MSIVKSIAFASVQLGEKEYGVVAMHLIPENVIGDELDPTLPHEVWVAQFRAFSDRLDEYCRWCEANKELEWDQIDMLAEFKLRPT